MTSQSHEPSARDYEREAHATRQRLANTLEELNDRLTPGQVFDEALTYARGGSGTFFRALTNAARENPIPALLIGTGCMLFLSEKMGLNRLMSRGGGGYGPSVRDAMVQATGRARGATADAVDAASSQAQSIAGSVRSGVRSASGYASEQTSEFTGAARRGAGAVSDTVSSASRSMRDTVSGTAQSARDSASSAALAASERAASTAEAVSDTARGVGEQIAHTAERLRQNAQSMADRMQEYSSGIGEQVAATAADTRQQAARTARQVKDTTMSFISEQPLLCAAIGLAFGAALAAAFPSSETEDELMGETSDAVKEKLGEVASQKYEAAKASAGKVFEEAKSSASVQGLTAAAAAEMARNIGEKVKRVASETASADSLEARGLTGVDEAR